MDTKTLEDQDAPTLTDPGSPSSTLRHVPGYEIGQVLGRGGMGVVYRAKHLALKRAVALKTLLRSTHLTAADLARFRAEAEILASLHHPNIVQIFDIGEADGHPYLALELLEGGTLWSRIRRGLPPPRESAALMVTLARAVHRAHEAGVIHRDLKPANVLLDSAGTPKIADFGIARAPAVDVDDTFLGTPGYVAPEVIALPWAATHSVDVYGLGGILYALLTGQAPFGKGSPRELLARAALELPVPPRKLNPATPRDLDLVCMKCLAMTPAERYPTAAALAADLAAWLDGEPISARRRGPLLRAAGWTRRNPIPAVLLGATLVGAVGSIGHMARVSNTIAEQTALQGAAQEVETLEMVTDYYTNNVVGHIGPQHRLETSTAYRTTPDTIPVPATLTIEIGEQLSARKDGQRLRMYSDLPFQNRKDGGPRDDFERRALDALKRNPSQPFYEFGMDRDRTVLRYAKARVLQARCVECHNAHPESPRHDWREGDVRGAIEVVRYLDSDIRRSRAGLRGTAVLVGAILGGMLLLSALTLLVNAVSRAKRQAARPRALRRRPGRRRGARPTPAAGARRRRSAAGLGGGARRPAPGSPRSMCRQG